MVKRFIYGGLFAIICLGLITLFFIKRFDKFAPVEVEQAIPGDALLFAERIDFAYFSESFLPSNRIWIDYLNISGRNEIDSLVNLALTQIRLSTSINDFLLDEGFSFSLHLIGKDQLMPLVYLDYSKLHNDHDFEHMMLSLIREKALVNERKYETEMLYEVSGGPGFIPGKFTFACMDGLCLISPSAMLVEESVRTIHAGTPSASFEGLQKVRATAGRYVHANLYLNYKKLPDLINPMLKESGWQKTALFATLASWGELDVDMKQDALVLNGMTHAASGEALFLNAFTNQSPIKMELHEKLPSGISYFLHLGVDDKSMFREEIMNWLAGRGEGRKIEAERERIEQLYGFDPLQDLENIMDNELAWFALDGTAGPEEELLIIETRSRSETVDVVMAWLEQYLTLNTFDMQSFRQVYRLDNQTSYNIYKLPDPFFKGLAPGRLFNAYFTVYEKYLIFGPSVEVLSRVIYKNVLQKTFQNDPLFKEISDNLANRTNLTLFMQPYAFLNYKSDLLDSELVANIEKMELFLRRIPGIVVQYSTEGELYYHSISCKYTSQIRDKALTVWESLLDTSLVMKPALVVNHNTSEKEIFIQDASNKVYLVNSTGRVLWKQKVEGPILGQVHQVDFYKNGKSQYLFNTAEKIHLMDRNGNYVERYPVSFRSPATCPVAVFDYDKSRNYRLFVATEDRKIYLYDIEGNLITGWKFGKTESRVSGEIQHFRVGDKDYIVVSDQNKTYFLDRKGKERIRLKERVLLSPRNPITLDMNISDDSPRWISTDTSGNVMAIYLDGTVSTLLTREAPAEHFFSMEDIDSDGVAEFIFAGDDELEVVAQDGKKLFGYRVRGRISERPDIYKFSASDVKIGITDQPRNRIYLINSDGTLYEGFPLEGTTRFSIGYFAGSDSRFNLIVGSENSFLYNYSID